jgi:hypothetical protein
MVEPVLPSLFLVFVEKVSACLFTPSRQLSTASALEDFEDDFGITADLVVNILKLEDVINGSP